MGVRIATGSVLIALVVLWLFFADYAIFTIGALFIYMVAAYEMGPLLKFKSRIPFLVVAAIASTVMFAIAPPGNYIEQGVPLYMKYLVVAALPFWFISIFLVKSYPNNAQWHNNKVINVIVGLLMLVPFLQGLLILRATNFAQNYNEGAYLVLCVMALVWAADSGAYFTGRSIGKTKLMPEVSPKKTYEGMYGGIVLAIVVMYLAKHYNFYSVFAQDELGFLVAAFGAIIFSVFGDLMESMLKRLVGIKDSGKIFPGHGGMLDRIDSQLAAVPVFMGLYWLVSGELF
ncbi:phosphatidate cytidylyltransferase [Anaerobiospirillum sp. NML120448]|uniref:phosphatidate cytidylyltransferase n=1 Tax=Anaerobiospirillum sp. NML120448 TaxID=2932816 RepID=UPI001FF16C62|nr:phosphatidate cytidylyltransferase [Anaerobiospirillum sp. NML120448]MCK0513451.1 phosphatidate cytidylyltransferase [Anaerobiospirillum sp. NML120448]